MAPESRRRSKGLRTFDPVLFSLKVRLTTEFAKGALDELERLQKGTPGTHLRC